jgi:glycosyltransferase involved in cell wall biosynthesis
MLLKKNNYDVFYTALPYSYQDIQIPSNTKFIYTVHGLRSLEYPWDAYILKYKNADVKTVIKKIISLFLPQLWNKYLIRKSKKDFNTLFSLTDNQILITISFHSKFSIAYFFPKIDISRIKILYPPLKLFNERIDNEKQILTELTLMPMKYILLITGDRMEKGAFRACKALYKLLSTNTISFLGNIKIVVVGISYKKPYQRLTQYDSRFLLTDYVSPITLEILYKNAHLFLFPTMSEGFGASPLEAMKHETICACSANSALTEIFGDSVLYFNPYDDVELGIRVLQSFDEDIRREKIEKMKARYALIRGRQDRDLNTLVELILSPPGIG